ncbi:influenza virus NS1A-binding protein-like [Dendrobium catenatum]|uniref:influenza virus NS1A-binding protein-like n=1 Tax=Dendrobium catenatum TaxID=906689 RepID=UPI0009F2A41C|nr:influenza virus NS1A-binding protein-like [Dendrobium catenatum]
MITRRGCHSMTVLNEKLFVMGGYDGGKMVSSVEIYDPRANAWMPGEPMKCNRGYGASALLGNSVFIIGGIENGENMIETIECYEEGAGWNNSRLKAVGKRCFFSAIVL